MKTAAKITADVNTGLGIVTIRVRHTAACTAATQAELEATTQRVADELSRIITAEELGYELHLVVPSDGVIVVSYAHDDESMCDGSEAIAEEVAIEAAANAGCVCPD
jgi:hypothetical protein